MIYRIPSSSVVPRLLLHRDEEQVFLQSLLDCHSQYSPALVMLTEDDGACNPTTSGGMHILQLALWLLLSQWFPTLGAQTSFDLKGPEAVPISHAGQDFWEL